MFTKILGAIDGLLDLINGVMALIQRKQIEANVAKAQQADGLAVANEQIRKANEIDAQRTPADKRVILDGM